MSDHKLKIFIMWILVFITTGAYAEVQPSKLKLGVNLYNAACKICHAPDKAKAMKAPAAFKK